MGEGVSVERLPFLVSRARRKAMGVDVDSALFLEKNCIHYEISLRTWDEDGRFFDILHISFILFVIGFSYLP